MAKEDKSRTGLMQSIRNLARDLTSLNQVSKELVDSATNSDTTSRDENINGWMSEIDEIVSTDFKKMTDYSSNDLSKFIVDFLRRTPDDKGIDSFKSIEDIFEGDTSGILQQFQTVYASDIAKMENISAIISQFPELQEARDISRDSILNADEHTNTISRELLFKNKSEASEVTNFVNSIEAMETEYKIPQKIKNHIVPKTLQYGRYYVYVVPYSDIFKRYAEKKKAAQKGGNGVVTPTLESVGMNFVETVLEGGSLPIDKSVKINSKEKSRALEVANAVMSGIHIAEDDLTIPVLESFDEVGALFDMQNKKSSATVKKDTKVVATDGVADIGNGKLDTDFSNINGVYMKLIDPRKVIPVKVLDTVIGYYYLHEQPAAKNRTAFSSAFTIDLTKGAQKKEDDFIQALSDKVVKSFNKPFLENNVEFKQSIASALIHNDVYKRDIKFQFISAEHMAEFKISEDEEGKGTGMLDRSIPYANLYLTLLHFNMMSIVTKSNDQRLYYIHSSGIEKNIANKIQSVARQMKSREMNYADLYNYRSAVSKVGAGKDAFVPVGKSGQQGLTFDTLAGQHVELYSELLTMLKTSAINNTGVPSVVIDYVNQADYAKSIVMGNLRFLARTITQQLEFNDCITEFYKKVMRCTGSFPTEVIDGFSYKLARPRSLDMTNIADMINNVGALADFLVNNLSGESSDKDVLDNMTRDLAYKSIVKDLTASLGWTKFEEIWEDAILDAKKILKERESRDGEGEGA